ncbi:hypothetical protein TNCT_415291 [Trichonephila clavata]|uniref:Uncharacterized protein n=1 Tax=Trichonephila clavata TaxID=2740835 RepID=A0A8X6HAN3_TRICU|nr:hypothetical protein TNCT_415291 [Trichonephila clavata]
MARVIKFSDAHMPEVSGRCLVSMKGNVTNDDYNPSIVSDIKALTSEATSVLMITICIFRKEKMLAKELLFATNEIFKVK